MGKLTVLAGLQPKVYDHERKAQDRLVTKLKNPILKKVLEQGGFGSEHRIVMFGQSGVGKTTLILKLLGAKTPSEDKKNNLIELAKHIRGNTEPGGAGTATVYRYRVSENDSGLVQYEGGSKKSFRTLIELETILHGIRQRVETGEWFSDQPVYLTLPKCFFHETGGVPWVITDLPGVHSRIKAEHAHVSDLIKAYVLHSNVLLVVEQSNQIAQLKHLRIPGLGPWNYFGRRCRLVVTHSMREESVKQRFRSTGKLSSVDLINYYTQTLEDEGIQLDGISGVFPMDYGNSWAELEQGEKQLFENVNDAMSGIHIRLIESLNRSLLPEEEFLSIMDIEKLGQRIACERSNGEARLGELSEKIHELHLKRGNLKMRDKNAVEKLDQIQVRREEIRDLIRENSFSNPWYLQPQHTHQYNQSHSGNHDTEWRHKRNYFNGLIHDFSAQVFNDRERIHDFLQENYESNYPPFSSSWRDWCQGWSDWDGPYYYWFIKLDAKAPRHSHRRAFRDGLRSIMEYWTPKVNEAVKEIFAQERSVLSQQADREKKLIRVLKRQITDIDNKIQAMETESNQIGERLEVLAQSQESDLFFFSSDYPRIRHEEFAKAFSRYFDKAKSEQDPDRALQYFAFCYQIDGLTQTLNQEA